MFGLRNRRRPRAAARTASAVRAAVTPVVAECLEERIVLSAPVSVQVFAVQSTGEAPGSQRGKFVFTATACTGTNPPTSVTVTFQLSGTASSGGQCGGSADYTGDILSGTVDVPVNGSTEVTFDAVDDQEVEDTETVIVTLDDGGDTYAVPPEGGAGRSASADIADNDVNVWVEATDDQAREAGRESATFTIHRQGGAALIVYYKFAGSAVPGIVDSGGQMSPADADYTGGSPVADPELYQAIIPAGQNSTTVDVTPVNDSRVEGDETVTLTLVADPSPGGPAYNAPGNAGPGSADATIKDLVARQAVDPDAPTTQQLDAMISGLDAALPDQRDAAVAALKSALANHPGIEPYLDQCWSTDPRPAVRTGLQDVLGPVRVKVEDNKVVFEIRYATQGITYFAYRPGGTQYADFPIPKAFEPGSGPAEVGGNPSFYTILPLLAGSNKLFTFTIEGWQDNDRVSTFTRSIRIDLISG